MKKSFWTPDIFGWQYKMVFEGCDQYDYIYLSDDPFWIEVKEVNKGWYAYINFDRIAAGGFGKTINKALLAAARSVDECIDDNEGRVKLYKDRAVAYNKLKKALQ